MTSHARPISLLLAVLLAACGGGGKSETCTPSTEVCNGRDDDCDGQIDEDLGIVTCGVGACLRTVPACAGGVPGNCVPGVPGTETCNGLDDDCDGAVDNGCECHVGQTQPCYSGPVATADVGACHAGQQTCVAGQWGSCDGEQLPVAETCNGIDDDCNGQVDDGLGVTSCGAGACARTVPSCEGGVATTCTPGDPSAEICNGVDDDCDGVVDGGNPGGAAACSTGLLGICDAGTTACTAGAVKCQQNVQPSAEACNGLDDDCDGVVDNGNPGGGASCATAKLGVCAAGTTACSNGALACVQNVQPSAEVCDGLDNNCDGVVDEGNPGGGTACTTGLLGACSAGTMGCAGGALRCVQNVQASAEVCNGLDDDCDGSVDEGNPGGGASCDTGRLGVCSPGVVSCTGGALSCLQLAQASAEVCNGLDDDCNGMVDDGNPGGGLACNTAKLGVCAPGTTLCSGGAVVCQQNVQPSPEVCDGLDNNCNGSVDEGNPGGGLACNTGLLGVCAAGTTSCMGSAVRCVQNVPATAEICGNGLDDDCNGLVDENC